MVAKNTYLLLLSCTICLLSACSGAQSINFFSLEDHTSASATDQSFLPSGQITLSFPVSALKSRLDEAHVPKSSLQDNNGRSKEDQYPAQYAPVVGLLPISASFNPADNEVWIEIVRDSNEFKIFKGQEVIRSFDGKGNVTLPVGEYLLRHKQKDPLWYAPDEYFSKRKLRVPSKTDNFRYRRGALGTYAIYPTNEFIIHSGPMWLEEIGGIKVSESDLAAIFSLISVGTPIIIK